MVPLRQIAEVYEQAARQSGDEALGLHVGERSGPRIVDLVDYALLCRATLAKAYEDLQPLIAAFYPEGELTLSEHDDVAVFTYRPDSQKAEGQRHQCEALLVSVMKLAQLAVGQPAPLLGVSFQHAEPRDVSEHNRIFAAPLRFNWPTNELAFAAHWLRVPLATADANLRAVLDRHLSDLLARVPSGKSFSSDLRRHVLRAYRSGLVDLPLLTKSLGVSKRTLQRRLREDGTSMHELTEDVRRELSLTLLRQHDLSLEEISRRLGYASLSAFSRAFRRWRGISPTAHRKADRAARSV